jgi:hypothetical protein
MADVPAVPLALTSQVAHIGHVVQTWLDELVAKNLDFEGYGKPIVIYGPEDDAANTAPPGIHWLPLTENIGAPQRLGAPGAPGPLAVRSVPVSFVLFGGVAPIVTYTDAEAKFHDCDLTEILYSKLINIMQRSASQFSYGIDSATWFNSGRTGIGMSLELVVSVRLPLIREDNPTITFTGATVNAEISHG